MESKSGKKLYITALNVVSCLAVVLMHTSSFWSFNKYRTWIFANLTESVCYFAVPVFLMISGATLMDFGKKYSLKEYFKKRIGKTVIPFVFWSLFAIGFTICQNRRGTYDLSPTAIIDSVINNKYIAIYYFFIILFGVYLSIPVLAAIDESKRKKVFGYIIIAAFTVNSLLPFLCSLTGGRINANSNFSFFACAGYLIFPVIGYCLDRCELSAKQRAAVYIAGAAGLLIHFFGTWYMSYQDNAINKLFKGYLNVPSVLYAAAIFLLFRRIPFECFPSAVKKAIGFFGGQTFGIYLIHLFIMMIVENNFRITFVGAPARWCYALAVFAVSGLIVKLLQLIPVVRRTVP